jgi:hypothetical protein
MKSTRPHPFAQRTLAIFATATLFAGCLTIEEHYTFRKDGSGSMEYVVDVSEMMEIMKSFESLGDDEDKDAGGRSDMDLTSEMGELKKIEGIRKVKVKKEKDGYLQRLSFRFADIDALNKALNVLMPDSTGIQSGFFRWEGNTLVRTNNRHALEMGDDMDEDEPGDSLDATAILQSMKYRYSFTFADAIASTEAAEGVNKEVPAPEQVKLDTDWSVIMRDPKALDLRITLAR